MRNSTQAKKGKVFHSTADNLRPAIIVIREVKNHISNESSVHFNLAYMLGYVIRYRITVRSDKDVGEGDLGRCFP